METDRSFKEKYHTFLKRSNVEEMFMSTLDKITSECNFDSVKSCLAIGPGEGYREIGFMEKCTANVNKFIAIEQDHESAESLKVDLRKRLPDVEGLVIEVDFHSWEGQSDPVDLLQMFHVLYIHYFKDDEERRSLLRKAHDSWLKAGGFLVVLSECRSSSKSQGRAFDIFERLGAPVTTWDEINSDILDVGFIKKHEYEIQYTRDYSNPDEALLSFFQINSCDPVTPDYVRSVIKELYRDGERYEGFHTLAVFQKPV